MFTRRELLKRGVVGGGILLAPRLAWPSAATAASPVANSLTKYLEPLPVPGAGIAVAAPQHGRYAFTQTMITRQLHPQLPATPLFAYDDGSGLTGQAGSLGPAIVAQKGVGIDVAYTNELPKTYPSWLPVDTRFTPKGNEIRPMTHLHGGFVAAASDGNPTITPGGFAQHHTQRVFYPNEQRATLLWYHDHAMGATRLNVVAGLAAPYILRDADDTGAEPNPIGLPGGEYEIPLVVQDRQFNADGTLLYGTDEDELGVTWIGEYFGDVFLVNGKIWPYLEVEPRLYRFRILNGCNSRIVNLDIGGAPLWQIGADGGMFDRPVAVKQLVLAPAERADVVVDFRALAGMTVPLKNTAPPPPVVTPAPPLTNVMQIRVGTTVSEPGPSSVPAALPGVAANLPASGVTRFITLNEIAPETPEWFLDINGSRFMDEPVTETPKVGSIEDWVYVNLTGDTHPMHVHLCTFQIVGRTPFDAAAYEAAYGTPSGVPAGFDPSPFATGPMQPAAPEERGYKDTVKANPGSFTTIRAKFDLPSGVKAPQSYVHHCHIVEHEDNDMMRPFVVTA
jgi:spore coat protein A, manganese oxidase